MTRHLRPAALLGWTFALCLLAGCGGDSGPLAPMQSAVPCGQGACVSTVAGSGEFGTADGPAQAASFFLPHAVAVDAQSQLHVADMGTDNKTLIAGGRVTTLAEDATDFTLQPEVAVDAAGNRYVADSYRNRILKTGPDGRTSVLAGTGQAGGQDGDAASASFSMPSGVALDGAGALYVADMGNRRIRKITLGAGAAG
jgi:DNA-binding beta-propeller fold protein YncE